MGEKADYKESRELWGMNEVFYISILVITSCSSELIELYTRKDRLLYTNYTSINRTLK